MEITRNNATPMYIQIADNLREKILTNELKPGESLGTQTEFEKTYGVSTITIRQALQILTEEGLIVSRQGKGTFVKPNKVEQELIELRSLSDIIKKSGFPHQINILKFEKVAYSIDVNDLEESCLYIERLHTVNEKNIALASIYIPYSLGSKFTIEDFEKHSVYHLLEKDHKIELGEAVQIIESIPADSFLAESLGIDIGTPILKAERTTFDKGKVPVEKITFYYRYDEFSFKIQLPVADHGNLWLS